MTPIPEPRCPACGSHLTIIADGRQESKLKPWLTNRVPFVSCDFCEAIYNGVNWLGVGDGSTRELSKRAQSDERTRRLLKPRVSAIVNRLREKANQIEAMERGR